MALPAETTSISAWDALLVFIVLLISSFAFGLLFERLRQSAILGYLVAGIVLGTFVFPQAQDSQALLLVAELGVSLLLFAIGLEFSIKRLRALGKTVLLGGALQIGVTAAVFFVIVSVAGQSWQVALAVGMVLAPSSTACVLRLLMERGELDSLHGRNCLGILLLQDLALVPLVLAMTMLTDGGGESGWLIELGKGVFYFALLSGLYFALASYVLPHLLGRAALAKNRELLIILAVPTALAAAWFAHELELSPAMGAFIAGMLLAGTPYATQVRADVSVLRTLFVTIFFASIGMLADLSWMADNLVLMIGAAVGLLTVKALIVWGVLLLLGVRSRHALAAGLCLAQAGEFAFVLAEIGFKGNLMSAGIFQLLISATLLSLLVTPYLVQFALPCASWMDGRISRLRGKVPRPEEASSDQIGLSDHIIVVGAGPTGRAVLRRMKEHSIPVVAVDLNPMTIRQLSQDGITALLGDAAQEEVLHHLHIDKAMAVVVTIPDHRAALAIIRLVRALAPSVQIIARARYNRYAHEFSGSGAHIVLDEEWLVGSILSERMLEGVRGRRLESQEVLRRILDGE